MKTELIKQLEELLLKDAGEVANDVRVLQREFQKKWNHDFEKARQEFINEGGKSREFEYLKQPEDIAFENLIEKYHRLKKESDAKIATEQARNLIVRQEIISKIKDLSKLSENVGAGLRKFQELQAQWKETGAVSTHKYKEIQSDYSRVVEDFHYNLKIYRDLQEHDLKKNYELKSAIIEKLKVLQGIDNIKEAERLIKVYRNEWDEIGPVPNSKWEALKQEYKTALEETYSKLKLYYTSLEEQKENNLVAKKALIEKTRELLNSLDEAGMGKWNASTEKLISIQNEWKATGPTTEKENEKVWAEFRALCDEFFDRKKAFFAQVQEKFASNRKIKAELIAKAEALQHSTDWQKTGLEIIKLQEAWKKQSSGGDREEPRLFQRFRKACNTFFDAKKAHFENQDASYEQNLVAKEAILARFNEFKLSENASASREQLKSFATEWSNAGMVPMKDKKRLNDVFYNRLDELYEQLQLNKQEKEQIQFRSKVERILTSENAFDLLRKEADYLKRLIDEINGRIRTYDNNLGFFKTSKGSNAFMQEIQDKINAEKDKLNELNLRRKEINSEMAKLRDGDKQKAEVSS